MVSWTEVAVYFARSGLPEKHTPIGRVGMSMGVVFDRFCGFCLSFDVCFSDESGLHDARQRNDAKGINRTRSNTDGLAGLINNPVGSEAGLALIAKQH